MAFNSLPQVDPSHCYLGIKSCGCFAFIGVDLPELADELAEDMREMVRSGGKIDRLPIEEGKGMVAGLRHSCDACAPVQEVDRE